MLRKVAQYMLCTQTSIVKLIVCNINLPYYNTVITQPLCDNKTKAFVLINGFLVCCIRPEVAYIQHPKVLVLLAFFFF